MLTQVDSHLVEQTVHNEINMVLAENKFNFDQPIMNDMKLNASLGLTSLDLARLVSVLDDKFNVSPFMEFIPITSIRTIGDLISAYQQMLSHSPNETSHE